MEGEKEARERAQFKRRGDDDGRNDLILFSSSKGSSGGRGDELVWEVNTYSK